MPAVGTLADAGWQIVGLAKLFEVVAANLAPLLLVNKDPAGKLSAPDGHHVAPMASSLGRMGLIDKLTHLTRE